MQLTYVLILKVKQEKSYQTTNGESRKPFYFARQKYNDSRVLYQRNYQPLTISNVYLPPNSSLIINRPRCRFKSTTLVLCITRRLQWTPCLLGSHTLKYTRPSTSCHGRQTRLGHSQYWIYSFQFRTSMLGYIRLGINITTNSKYSTDIVPL